jgi:magnesium transporter
MPRDRHQLLVDTLRRFFRRGADAHLRRTLEKTRSEDIAVALAELMRREARLIFVILLDDAERAAEVLCAYDDILVADLIEGLSVEQLLPLFAHIPPDDAADLLAAIPDELSTGILAALADDASTDLEQLMQFGEDTAGGIMSPEVFALDKELTAREAIVALQEAESAEIVFYVYCINVEGTLVGVLSLRQLLTVAPAIQLSELMNSDVISVPVTMDQEDVAQIVARYDLLGVPVVDEFNKLVGVITVDDVIDVLRDEATEDMMRMAGVGDEDLAVGRGTLRSVRIRLPWLMASLGGGLGAAFLITAFEEKLATVAILAAFIPIVMGLGGNVGVQSSTIVVRSIAMGQLDPKRVWFALWSEIKVAVIIATVCSLLVGCAAYVMGGSDLRLGAAVCNSILAVMLLGATLGTGVPMLSQRLGIDPAVATGPILTTGIDLLGVLIYFMLATAWLGL